MSDDLVPASTCAWCSAAAPIGATACPACGAALAQRESLGDVRIAGVTDVDPALLEVDGRPIHIPGSSPTQGMAGGVMVAAMAGGPLGLAALGGIAVVGAAEYAMAGRRDRGVTPTLDDVGRPSEVALQALERIAQAESGAAEDGPPGAAADDPWRDEPGRSRV
ncbi:MAG TPA: hypothetical protein VK194_08965 [Candidatus Deferrimicrobium sp.]|nr:hypothetical protein [Candidatus Deferrimicrobium sp.]